MVVDKKKQLGLTNPMFDNALEANIGRPKRQISACRTSRKRAQQVGWHEEEKYIWKSLSDISTKHFTSMNLITVEEEYCLWSASCWSSGSVSIGCVMYGSKISSIHYRMHVSSVTRLFRALGECKVHPNFVHSCLL